MPLKDMLNTAALQGNPLSILRVFIDKQDQLERARDIQKWRFVGYVLELGYEKAKIITCDPYKLAVGGIPRGSFLIMTPTKTDAAPPHFTLLRVTGVSPTPLSNQVQQTYFELHKKSMPELDVWTQSELQWGALDCDVLGMFYANPNDTKMLAFSGDVNNVVSAHRYAVFSPDAELLDLIVNGTVREEDQIDLGELRTMECQLASGAGSVDPVSVKISMGDFKGCRTAMFGKTRLGKSNVVKLIASGMLDATSQDNSVGQLIFDINGEYANDNPQDGNASVRSAYEDRCVVYALTKRAGTPSKALRINFFEQPASGIEVIASMLERDKKASNYVKSFASVQLASVDEIKALPPNEQIRAIRKIQVYWAILNRAGFEADEERLIALGLSSGKARGFNPGFTEEIRNLIRADGKREIPPQPKSLEEMTSEYRAAARYVQENGDDSLKSSSGNPLFDSNDIALLKFLEPSSGSGPSILHPYRRFHAADAGDFIVEVLELIDAGKTVILDLGNATDEMRKYFSDMLSRAVFSHQEGKFVGSTLGNAYVQLYFEEAHNLFPPDSKDLTGIYARFAKEGAKFHIGMVYSTQSPSTINKELLAQTENFFVGHLSSQDEAKALARVQVAFSGCEEDILRAKTPGYMRMLTMSHRFVVPVQARKFEATIKPKASGKG